VRVESRVRNRCVAGSRHAGRWTASGCLLLVVLLASSCSATSPTSSTRATSSGSTMSFLEGVLVDAEVVYGLADSPVLNFGACVSVLEIYITESGVSPPEGIVWAGRTIGGQEPVRLSRVPLGRPIEGMNMSSRDSAAAFFMVFAVLTDGFALPPVRFSGPLASQISPSVVDSPTRSPGECGG